MNKTDESRYILQHLANERTYLNWIRSTISVSGISLAILRFKANSINTHGVEELRVLCYIILLFSLFFSIYSTSSYLKRRRVINNQPSPANASRVGFTVVVLVIVIVVAVFLIGILNPF